jgi:hypothetical protein
MNGGARQCRAHGNELWRTATSGRTAAARQRSGARQRWQRTAKGFAVQFLHAHGKDGFAVEDFAGQSLP